MTNANRFFVRGTFIDPGALLDPQTSKTISLSKVLPSQQLLADFEEQGKILAGGVIAGCREILFIVDVASNDELSRFLSSLPFWNILRWDVEPLQTFSSRAKQSHEIYGASQAHPDSLTSKDVS